MPSHDEKCSCGAAKTDESCQVCSASGDYWCDNCERSVPEKRCPHCGLKARKIRSMPDHR